jgi:uncharacterized membrane protein
VRTVAITVDRTDPGVRPLVDAFLLAAMVPPFLGAALSDYAYTASNEVQWINFASWLIVGGLVFGGIALACALVELAGNRRAGRIAIRVLLLLATWVLGFVNALVHARDAWASMPAGFVLSVVVTVLACVAAWLGFSRLRAGGAA